MYNFLKMKWYYYFPLTLLLSFHSNSFAADYQIFEVHKSIPMENHEAGVKDYYINAGAESGLKKGMFVKVTRPTAVQDPAKNTTQGTLKISIGLVQIIQSEHHISVAREYHIQGDEERPTVEFESIMMGDVLDMDSATMDAPKIKTKSTKNAKLEEDYEQRIERLKAELQKVQAVQAAVPSTAPSTTSSSNSNTQGQPNTVPASSSNPGAGAQNDSAKKTPDNSNPPEVVSQSIPPQA